MSAKSISRKPKTSVVFDGNLDMSSPATLATFRAASAAYTAKAVKTKASAVKTLQNEGILTEKGKLSKMYAPRKA